MYFFLAHYIDMNTDNEFTRKIEFDGDNVFNNEKECYLYAMSKAYDDIKENELLSSLEFIGC